MYVNYALVYYSFEFVYTDIHSTPPKEP